MTTTKKTSKKAAERTGNSVSRSKIVAKQKLLNSLSKSVENIEVVRQVACVIEELQGRAFDVREEAGREMKKLLKICEANYKGLEDKVHKVTTEAKKQAQISMIQLLQKWHEHKDKLPEPLASEIEKVIGHIGSKVVAATSKKATQSTKKPKSRASKTTAKKSVTKKTKAASAKKVASAKKKKASVVRKAASTKKRTSGSTEKNS